jgi:hypothetical protein
MTSWVPGQNLTYGIANELDLITKREALQGMRARAGGPR